jgi:hypothetical protein
LKYTMTMCDRITDFRRVPARELLETDGNPRTRQGAQRDALRGVLEPASVAAVLIAFLT